MPENQIIDVPSETAIARRERKRLWQRWDREKFKMAHGFSKCTHYRFGKVRPQILVRDRFKCVKCGMTDSEHKAKWGRPITVDHKDRNPKNNHPSNLQTLCLKCHGGKDLLPRLRQPKRKISIAAMIAFRREGKTFKEIGIIAGINASRCHKLIKDNQ